MSTFKYFSTLVLMLAGAANIKAATAYIYTFEFDWLGSLPNAVIQYAAESLPSPTGLIDMQYVAGDVNGCRPGIIESYFYKSTSVRYGPLGGSSADCATPNGVTGFEFSVENAFNPGTFPTMSAGRGLQDGDITRFYYGGGQLTITEQPTGPQQPVPEPAAAVLAGTALLLLAFARGEQRIINLKGASPFRLRTVPPCETNPGVAARR